MINKSNDFQMNIPLIRLWNTGGIGLILLYPSGIWYTNQTGGYSCFHPEVEGIFVPLVNEMYNQEKELYEHFTGPKWNGWCSEKIDKETADFIDQCLKNSHTTHDLSVDREKLEMSHEAWVYVNIGQDLDEDFSLFYGFDTNQGILTWNNSD